MNDGGPIFPNVVKHLPEHERHDMTHEYELLGGISLRDWFAGIAQINCPINAYEHANVAAWCYDRADAMLAKREK